MKWKFIPVRQVVSLCLALAGAFAFLPASAQVPERYFPETGHSLDPAFASFFDDHGGVAVLGYPITDSFVNPATGQLQQYFENACLERRREDRGALTVTLSPLGELMGGGDPPRRHPPPLAWIEPGCRHYETTGHSICYAFLDSYQEHGGPEVLGLPISDFKLEAGRLVQYLQAFRLDWHPDLAPAGQVVFAPLGRMHFERSGLSASLLTPRLPDDPSAYRVLSLEPDVALSKSVVKPDDTEQVLVLVRDQNGLPVEGASVTLAVRYPSESRNFLLPLTDAEGLTRITLEFARQVPGSNVELQAWAVFQGLQAETRDSFRVWW